MRKTWMAALCVLGVAAPTLSAANPLVVQVTTLRRALPGSCYDCGVHRSYDGVVDTIAPETRSHIRQRQALRDMLLSEATNMTPEALYVQGLAIFTAGPRDLDEVLGIEIMELAAERGHVPAQLELASIFGNRGLLERSDYWRERAAAAGKPSDWRDLAATLAVHGLGEDRTARAHSLGWYSLAAEASDVNAEFALGQYYDQASAHRAEPLAVYWYGRAADGGLVAAMMALARIETDPQSPAYDDAAAIGWLVKADAVGQPTGQLEAQRKLCHWPPQATAETRRAAMVQCLALYDAGKLGSYDSIEAVGTALFDGDLIAQDYGKAWQALNSDGRTLNAYRRGRMLLDGLGVTAAPELGRLLIRYAARHGDAAATNWLATTPQPAASAEAMASRELDLNTLPAGAFGVTVKLLSQDSTAPSPAVALDSVIRAAGSDIYPDRAADDEIEGRTLVVCPWTDAGGVGTCEIEDETPVGYGFGKAAAKLFSRMSITSEPGGAWPALAAGKWSAFEIDWMMR